jgi:hypothetical protein
MAGPSKFGVKVEKFVGVGLIHVEPFIAGDILGGKRDYRIHDELSLRANHNR